MEAGVVSVGDGRRREMLPRELVDVVFSWSIEDIYNKDLFKHQVGKIPLVFDSVDQYLESFIFPLLEETREDICSSLEKISDTPYSEIIHIAESVEHREIVYTIQIDSWKNDYLNGGKERYIPSPGDILVLSDVRLQHVSDLNRYGSTYVFSSVSKVHYEDESLANFTVHPSKVIGNDGNMGKLLYASFLVNLTTIRRIWKAISCRFAEMPNLNIIRNVLSLNTSTFSSCDVCCQQPNDIEEGKFSTLNHSQISAILSSLVIAQCNHRNFIKLIWGPPGTGKTKTVSELLFSLLSMKIRVLTCAPTNVAISELTSRVLNLVKENSRITGVGKISVYTVGHLLLLGNERRLKVGDNLREIFLDYRVSRLLKFLSPQNGWKHHFNNLIIFFMECVTLYETRKENIQEKVALLDFVKERYTALSFSVKTCIISLCTHLTIEIISKKNFEKLLDLLNLLECFGSLLYQASLRDVELKSTFLRIKQSGGENAPAVTELGHSSGENHIVSALCNTGGQCLHILKLLRNNLITPTFGEDDKKTVLLFCLNSASIVFCTASSSARLFVKDKSAGGLNFFSLLIMDEASQLKESESLVPLQIEGVRHAILIGDERQLPATVKSKVAEGVGFGRSLFERLSLLGHPKDLLSIQYRMHPSISLFPNSEFYSGQILDAENVKCESYEKCYLPGRMYGSYSFINVNDGKEETDDISRSKKNMVEVAVILQIVHSLFKAWLAVRQKLSIGIISPYAAQVAVIQKKLENKYDTYGDFVINVKSIDGFQGGEEDFIVITTVRSNNSGSIEFISNSQRTNVALTRARHCLWIVGNGATLNKSGSVWESLVQNAKDRQCFFDAQEDKELARTILQVKKEQNQMDDLLNKDSVLFRDAIWRVLFSNDFMKSFTKIKSAQTKKSMINFLLKLSCGWRPRRNNVDPANESYYDLVKQYKIEDLYVICTTDIKKYSNYCQILKIWDILPSSECPKMLKRLSAILETYSDDYIHCCKEKCFDGKLEIPVSWDICQDFVKHKTPGITLLEIPENSNDRSFVENTNVSESLLLMKFYSLSSGVVSHLLSGRDGKEIDIPFEVTDQEHEIIAFPKSTFILGRSGTGKTTVLTMKLIQREQQWYMSSEGFCSRSSNPETSCKQTTELVGCEGTSCGSLRQMFVTVSPKLCIAIKNHIAHMKSFTCGEDVSERSHQDMYDIGDNVAMFANIPDSFSNLPHVPLVITFQKFLLMLDGSTGSSFFEKYLDNAEIPLDKTEISKSFALQSLMRQKEVSYGRFASNYWPHLNAQLTRKLEPSVVFTEIISHIKGGLTNTESLDGMLSREAYLNLSEYRASSIGRDVRDVIYDIFLDYEKKKLMNAEFDLSDLVIDLHRRLKLSGSLMGEKVDFVYVDEVQDLTMRQIALFKYVCNNFEEGFVFAGDTAQTIARGVDFRFQEIRSLFYNLFLSDSRSVSTSKVKGADRLMSDIFHLNQNFRTHAGVLDLAQSVVEILYCFFPDSVDRLQPETSVICGEAPLLLETTNDENAIMTIFGKSRNSTSTGANSFGSEQVILVRDDNSKRKIPELVKKQALVLTILECKGLEFQDVLLYNFFGESPLQNKWRVIYDYMKICNILDDNQITSPKFEMSRHNILCSELKQLYVAITRTRQRLWICESVNECSMPMFDYWKKLCLVRVRHLDYSIAQDMCVASSKEDWRIRGIKLFNEGNFEMATMCFERAEDVYRERWARASGLRASAEHVIHSNFDMARNLMTEAAVIYETIGKSESAANCYIEIKDFKKAGTLLLEKCGESRVKDAGDCFALAGCWSLAAETYSKGRYFEKCLSICSEGHLYSLGLKFIGCWKPVETSVGLKGITPEFCSAKDTFLQKAALHYHELKDIVSMMKCVQMFSSMEFARTFLKSRCYLDELLAMEEKMGNFAEAAEVARMKLDLLLQANMLEKAGQFEEASKVVIFHVVATSLWTDQHMGWPMKQFKEKEYLLEKAKSLAEKSSESFSEYIGLKTCMLSDRDFKLADLVGILTTSRRLENIEAEIFFSRRALDIHLCIDSSKYLFETELYSDPERQMSEKLRHDWLSSETLVHVWNFWKKKILSVLENLRLFGAHSVNKNLKCWDFCCEYFGTLEIGDGKLAILNPKASWIRVNDARYDPACGTFTYIEEHQFASAARSYWSSELLVVGEKVVTALQKLYKIAIRKSLAPLSRATVLLRMFELLKFIKDPDLSIKVKSSTVQNFPASVPLSFFDAIFPIYWRLISVDMIKLRENDLSSQLLNEVLRVIISGINSRMTYGKIGKIAMLCFANRNLDQQLFEIVTAHRELAPQWKMFFECVFNKSGFGKVIFASNLHNALRSTFEINWRAHADYITPQCFIYLAERLLFYSSSCKGIFYTTKAYLMESLCCLDWASLEIDNQTNSFVSETFDFLASIVHQLLFDRSGMLEWVNISGVNKSEVYPLLVLRLTVIIILVHLNSGQYLNVLLESLCWSDNISLLPQAFRSYLQLVGPGSPTHIFANALATISDPLVIVGLKNSGAKISCSDAIFIDMNIVKCRDEIFEVLVGKNEDVKDQIQAVELGARGDSSSGTNGNPQETDRDHCATPTDGVSEDSALITNLRLICETFGALLHEHKINTNDIDFTNFQEVKSKVEDFVRVVLAAMSCLSQEETLDFNKDMLDEIQTLVDDLKKLSQMLDVSDRKHETNTKRLQELADRLVSSLPRMQAFLALLENIQNSSEAASAAPAAQPCDKGKKCKSKPNQRKDKRKNRNNKRK